jgi:hypothetical protein
MTAGAKGQRRAPSPERRPRVPCRTCPATSDARARNPSSLSRCRYGPARRPMPHIPPWAARCATRVSREASWTEHDGGSRCGRVGTPLFRSGTHPLRKDTLGVLPDEDVPGEQPGRGAQDLRRAAAAAGPPPPAAVVVRVRIDVRLQASAQRQACSRTGCRPCPRRAAAPVTAEIQPVLDRTRPFLNGRGTAGYGGHLLCPLASWRPMSARTASPPRTPWTSRAPPARNRGPSRAWSGRIRPRRRRSQRGSGIVGPFRSVPG